MGPQNKVCNRKNGGNKVAHSCIEILKSNPYPLYHFAASIQQGKSNITDMNQQQKIETHKKAPNYVKRGYTFL